MRTRSILASAALLASPLLWTSPASATLISLGFAENGVNGGVITTVANDGGSGSLVYGGSNTTYGTFTVNQITATGAPVLDAPNLDSTSLNVSGSQAGTLFVYITETGLTSPLAFQNVLSSFTSNALNGLAVGVQEMTFSSSSNQPWTGTQLGSATFSSIGTSTATTSEPAGPLYSETMEYIIRTTGKGDVTDTIEISALPNPVPEPATVALFGSFLLGLGLLRRRWQG